MVHRRQARCPMMHPVPQQQQQTEKMAQPMAIMQQHHNRMDCCLHDNRCTPINQITT